MQQSTDTGMHPERGIEGNRLLLVVPEAETRASRDEITLAEIWSVLWNDRWLVIAICVVMAAASVAYALLATQWYRAEVVLVPVKQKQGGLADSLGGLGGLSGLASMAGINLGGDDSAEPIAVLQSKNFTAAFIEEQQLMPVLFADKWDSAAGRWIGDDPKKWPDVRDGVKLFDKKLRVVDQDKNTNLVTLTVEWKDAALAATWANLMVERVNARMRERALVEAERNIKYLRQEMTESNIVTLQQSVGRLLENELQRMMLARGNAEYSFRFVDRADPPPKWRSRPNRPLVAILGTLAGGLLAVIVAFTRHTARQRKASAGAA
jgi:uncharacterized protein involved in exopolysaccharide biosynthesis